MAHILVIDDEELVRFSVRQILEAAGHRVDEASDGVVGTNLLKANSYDLVITDIVMPQKEGIEMIIEVKHERPDLKVIAISGGGRVRRIDFLDLARQFGADAVIAKPFDEGELMVAVDRLLPA